MMFKVMLWGWYLAPWWWPSIPSSPSMRPQYWDHRRLVNTPVSQSVSPERWLAVSPHSNSSTFSSSDDMKMISAALLLTSLTAYQAAAQQAGVKEQETAAYLGSITIQDSCQFSLCGPQFTQEFLEGSRPKVGSCSGNCNLLAVNLVSNKFTR